MTPESEGEPPADDPPAPDVPMPDRPPVTLQDWRKFLTPALAVIGAVLVTLFIQNSDGNPPFETVGLILTSGGGALLIYAAVIVIVTRRREHAYPYARLVRSPLTVCAALLAGPALLVSSFNQIAAEPTDFTQPGPLASTGPDRAWPDALYRQPGSVDSTAVALRNLVLGDLPDGFRIVTTVINQSEAPLVLDTISVEIAREPVPANCTSAEGTYVIQDTIQLTGPESVNAQVQPDSGALRGTRLAFEGTLRYDDCGRFERFDLRGPAAISLDPLETFQLGVELKSTLQSVGRRHLFSEATEPEVTTERLPDISQQQAPDDPVFVTVGVGYQDTDTRASITEQF